MAALQRSLSGEDGAASGMGPRYTTRPAVCFVVLGAASRFPSVLGKTAITELHHQLKGGSFWMLLLCLKRGKKNQFCLFVNLACLYERTRHFSWNWCIKVTPWKDSPQGYALSDTRAVATSWLVPPLLVVSWLF